MKLTQSEEDRDSLSQVIAMITEVNFKLENQVDRKHFNDIFYKSAMTKVNRQQSLQKLGQLQQSIEDFPKNGPDIASNSSELVYGKCFSCLDHTFPVHLFYQLYMQETGNLNITGLVQ